MNTEKIELYAIVELFGHNQIAGKVTEYNFGASTFVRVDVPETETQPTFTRLLNPSAIYAINPVTREVMEAKAEMIQVKPIESWDIKEMHRKILQLQAENKPYDDNEHTE